MTKKLFAIDVDGTLQNSEHQVSEENAQAVRAACTKGHHIVLTTGKQYSAIEQHVTRLGLVDPQITAGGAVITNPSDNKDIFRLGIPQALASEVVSVADEIGITTIAFRDNQTFTREINHDIDYMLTYGDPYPSLMQNLEASFETLPLQIMCIAYQNDELYENAFNIFYNRFHTRLGVRKSSPYYIEFTHPNVSKGNTLTWLAKHLNMPLASVVAIGDSFNDLSMFKIAGMSIAMGNSPEAVKEAASRVVEDNDAHGVAKILQELI